MNTNNTQDPYLGTVIASRWRVDRPLSAGGMGAVYVASHTETGRRVALKVIKAEGAMDPEMIARFKRESSSLAAVSHPNIVTFLDCGVDNGTLYLVMELLHGHALRERMTQAMPWSRAFRICSDVLRGLAAVHAHGLVHRDLKPENIFLQQSVGHDDFAKLIDFGIVRFEQPRTSASVNTRTGAVIGTPGYIAPETLAGKATTPLSDLYAVGVILYELITNTFPFDGESVQAMLVRQLFEAVAPPSSIVPVPKHVDDIVMSLLARDPADRPQTAMEALSLVSRALGTCTPPPPVVNVANRGEGGSDGDLSTMYLDASAFPVATPLDIGASSGVARDAALAGRAARRVSTNLRRDRRAAAAALIIAAGAALFARVGFAVSEEETADPGASTAQVAQRGAASGDDDEMSIEAAPFEPRTPANAPAAAAAPASAAASATPNSAAFERLPLAPLAPTSERTRELALKARETARENTRENARTAKETKKRAPPTSDGLAALVKERRDELLSCGGDRVPRDVVITAAPNGTLSARTNDDDEPARCARARIAAWNVAPFTGAAVSTTTRVAFGTKKPALPSK